MRGNMLKAVEKRRAYEDIVRQILDLIEKGRLKKGDQLPTERELTDTFKVSRATVREAIRTLESMRLVESRQGNGTYVLASSEEALVQPLAAAHFSEKDDLIDIFSVRRIIEPSIAQLAASYATRDEIKELEEILEEQERALESGSNMVMADSAFHSALARMAKNRVLERLLLAIVDLLAQTREEYLQNEERANSSLRGHRKVLSAIRDGDCAAAKEAMLHHLDNVEGLIFKKKKGGGRCE